MHTNIILLAICVAFTAVAGTPAAASVTPPAQIQSIATGENQASTDIFTWENEDWFNDLINLNPDAWVVPDGPGITVTNPSGRPLVLPTKRKPADVTLETV